MTWSPIVMVMLGVAFVACQPSTDSGGHAGGATSSGGRASGGAGSGGAGSGGSATGGATSSSGGAVGGRTATDAGGAIGGGSGGGRTTVATGGGGSGGGGSGAGGSGGGGSGAGGTGGGGTGGGTTAGPVGRPSAGCGLPGTSGRKDLTVTIRGVPRTYRVQFPTPYVPDKALPLVFYFHWLNGTIDDVTSLSEPAVWEVGNAASEAAFVWPQGLAKYDVGGLTGWDITCDGEDMELFDAIVGQLAKDRCIDQSRIFSTGFSFGADMSNALACCRGREVIRAVAPASGNVATNVSCPAAKTPAVRFSYGTKDTAYPQKDFQDVVTFYRTKLGCGSDWDSVPVAPCGKTWTGDSSTVTCACKSYRNCEQPVIDCMFTNMPHTTAAGWRDDTWAFFSGFAAER